MKAKPKHGHRSAVAIVGGVDDELIVERQPYAAAHRKAVVRLEQTLRGRARELAVPDQDSETTGIEKSLRIARDAIEKQRSPDMIVRSFPALAAGREPQGHRLIDVGEVDGLVLSLIE